VHGRTQPGPTPAGASSVKGDTCTQALDGEQRGACSTDKIQCLQGESPYCELAADFELPYSAMKRLCCCLIDIVRKI